MISQIFFLSNRGDILINRNFRSDLFKETPEIFFRNLKKQAEDSSPVFSSEGIIYLYLHIDTIYFVATSRFNVQPSLILHYMNQIISVIKDFCGGLSENIIRKNLVLVYEILDEMMDFGYPQLTNTEQIKDYIVTPVEQEKSFFNFDTSKIFKKSTINAQTTKETIANAEQKNAIFFDVIESLNIVFNSQDRVTFQSVDGVIQVKSYLTGHPQLDLEFNDISFLSDYSFHECVNEENFSSLKKLVVKPIMGQFDLMNYRISNKFNLPLHLTPYIKQDNPYKVEFEIILRCMLDSKLEAKVVHIRFNVPECTSSVKTETEAKDKSKRAEYQQDNREVVWTIFKMKGQEETKLVTKISLSEEIGAYQLRKEIGPIKMQYEIVSTNLSDLKIHKLDISGSEKENPDKWVRYLTSSDNYMVRI